MPNVYCQDMTKKHEADYYKNLDKESKAHANGKPFTDDNAGMLIAQLAAVLELLPKPPKRLLDLGSGTGWTSRFLAEAGYNVTGYDLSPEATKVATKKTPQHLKPRLNFRTGDFENLPFKNDFDCATFVDSLHHSEDEVAVLKQVHKALKSGGVCIAVEPGSGHAQSPSSIQAIEKYGVTERDMPPRLITKAARQIGFRTEVYTHPAPLFRATYSRPQNSSGLKKAIFANPLLRSILQIERVTVERFRQGLVVLTKI